MDETTQTYEPATDAPPLPDNTEEGARVRWLTDEEAWAAFNEATQYYLGISGDEFRRRWETGEYGEEEADRGPTSFLLGTMPPRK